MACVESIAHDTTYDVLAVATTTTGVPAVIVVPDMDKWHDSSVRAFFEYDIKALVASSMQTEVYDALVTDPTETGVPTVIVVPDKDIPHAVP